MLRQLLQNKYFKAFAPLGLLFIAYLAMPYRDALPGLILDNLEIAPQLLCIAALSLGLQYRKQRIFIFSILMLLSYWALDSQFTSQSTNQQLNATVYAAIAIFLPLALAASATLTDQSVNRMQMLLMGAAIALTITVIKWAASQYAEAMNVFLFLELSDGRIIQGSALPDLAAVGYMIALLKIGGLFFLHTTMYEGTFLAILIASFLGLSTGFTQPDTALYVMFSSIIILMAIGETAYTLAYIDELTELPGRRALNETLSRIRGKYCIAMLDVDHFKKFNDTYGHDVGDQVLRMVASKMKNVGGNGACYRYGGEEFAVVFPGKNSKEAFPHLSILRENIDNTHMVLRNKDTRPHAKPDITPKRKEPWKEVHVTISIGVADNTDDLNTTEQVLKGADKALYKSKEKGRNRISQYGLESQINPSAAQRENPA